MILPVLDKRAALRVQAEPHVVHAVKKRVELRAEHRRMVVVADTSPINYLVLIAQIDLLKQLYTRILIPPAVLTELKHSVAPKPVRDWADNPPVWVEVLSPKSSLILAQLDLGESEAIALATEVHAEVVLIDEQAGHHAIAAAMRFADHSHVELERLHAERAGEARRRGRE